MAANIDKMTDLANQPHVLVVDDDARICDLVSRFLRDHGFVVMTAASSAQARGMLEHFSFDVMVVDVMMPGESGVDFVRHTQAERKTPVLLLTALGEAEDRIAGLEAGADDYLAKPFEPRELVLRLNAILRRTAVKVEVVRSFKIGDWHFDAELSELRDGEKILKLTTAESELIKALAETPGQPVSRDDLAKKCGADAGERTIDVQVTRLRRKIEKDSRSPRYLQTVRGKGYLLRIEDV